MPLPRQTQHAGNAERLALGLAYFSIGLGVLELLAPGRMARLIGSRRHGKSRNLLRAMGAREIANGVAMLSQPRRPEWLWTRVAGDALDLALLAPLLRRDRAQRAWSVAAASAVIGVTILDVLTAMEFEDSHPTGIDVTHATTINKPVAEVYQFWRSLENLPRFMRHLETVEVLTPTRSRWVGTAPAGLPIEWEAVTTEDVPNQRLAWHSVTGAAVPNTGEVRFVEAPGGQGTEVHVRLRYWPPAGHLGQTFAWLFGASPEQQIREDLHRFKQLMETGEIPLSEGPGLSRPAQPPAQPSELKEYAGVPS
jgi:uncharacterized membrane protein